MTPRRALRIHAGPLARAHLRERGLKPQDVRVVAGAAGGPKGLTLLPLDAFLFGHWLPQGGHEVHLVGASIGAWRMAAACTRDPVEAFRRLGHDYIHERYGDRPGRMPPAGQVSRLFRQTLERHFHGQVDDILSHPQWRLHVITAHGRGVLNRPGRVQTALGYAAASALNAISRRQLGVLIERLWFHTPGFMPPFPLNDLRTIHAELSRHNFAQAVLASCAIPFWLDPVLDIPGAPAGACWDGGITDYHVHLSYARMDQGLALIPHFQPWLVPGWLDKPLRRRHGATAALDNAVVLSPDPEWVASLPGGKIPDRSDFKRFLHDPAERERRWSLALDASRQLADDWAWWVGQASIESQPLPTFQN